MKNLKRKIIKNSISCIVMGSMIITLGISSVSEAAMINIFNNTITNKRYIQQNKIEVTEKTITTRPSTYVRIKGYSNLRDVSYYQVERKGKWIASANENYGSFLISFKHVPVNKIYSGVQIVAYDVNHNKIGESNSFNIVLDINYKGSVVDDEYVEPDGVVRARKSISVYSKGSWHLSTLEQSMKEVRDFGVGIEEIIISIGIGNNCDTNNPQANLTKEEIIRLCEYAKQVGYKKITLKCHSAGEYDGLGNQTKPTDPAKWHKGYKDIVDMVSDVAVEQGHKDFIISNELGNITNFESNKLYWQDMINLVKSKGLKVGSSVNYPEMCQNDGYQLFNDLDFIGFNVYPAVTNNSKQWANENIRELKKAWYVSEDLIETIPMLKQFKQTGKEVWITEAGCIPSTRGLRYPAYWGPGQTEDNEVQEIYYKAMMPVVSSSPYVDVFSIWAGNIDDAFSFMSRPSGNIVKQYWKENDAPVNPQEEVIASGSYSAKLGDQYVYVNGSSNVKNASKYSVKSTQGWIGYAELVDGKFKVDISRVSKVTTFTGVKIVAVDSNNSFITESKGNVSIEITNN